MTHYCVTANEEVNLFLSLFKYKFTYIFSNTFFSIPYNPSSILLNLFLSLSESQYTSIFFNLLFSISFHFTYINVNLFLSLCQTNFTSIFFNLSFSISFYSLSIHVNLLLSSCQFSRCLSLPITNFKLTFYLSLSLLTTKEDQSTTKIFYILFLYRWLYFMANEVIVFPYVMRDRKRYK